MKKAIYFLIVFLLINKTAYSNENCKPYPENTTSLQTFVEDIKSNRLDLNVVNIPNDNDKCKPELKTILITGNPVCLFKGMIPVNIVMASQIDEAVGMEFIMYLMRGTKKDVDFSRSAYNDLKSITKEYNEEIKGPRFVGKTYAWQDNNKIIALGYHEPGYEPIDRSLHLMIGSKRSLEVVGRDINSCAK